MTYAVGYFVFLVVFRLFMLWVVKKFGTMADGSNRGSVDAMSSQGNDEVFHNVVDEVGDSSQSDTSGESVISAITNLEV